MAEQVQFYSSYDVASTSYVYGRVTGPFQGEGGVTAATSTTVTAAATARNPFAGLKAGDLLWFRTAEQTVVKRKVATATSTTSLVASGAALTFTSIPWHYLPFTVGTGLTNGWHRIAHFRPGSITIHILLGTVAAAGGVDINIEIRGSRNFQADPNEVWSKNYAAGSAYEDAVIVTETGSDLRVGVKGGSGFAGTDDITVFMTGVIRK
jgi:hypothetical protein